MSMPFVPFYPSDWLAGTRGLTAAETGVYITLVAMMYEREAPLDMPADRLARLCGCTVKAFGAARETLLTEGKLILRDGGLWNARVEKECVARKNRSEKAQQSADYRWQKDKQKQGKQDANASPEQCLADANHNHNHNHKEERESARKRAPPKRASSLPENWVPSDRNLSDASDRNFTAQETENEASRFRDYHLAHGSTFKDWDAAWRTWLGNARKFAPRGMAGAAQAGGRGQGSSIASIAARRHLGG